MEENSDFVLVPVPPSELDKTHPGTKRILAAMVAEILAVARKREGAFQVGETVDDVECHLTAAEEGSASSLFWLGVNFLYGNRVPRDHIEAYKWLYLAAGQGNEEACVCLNEYFYRTPESEPAIPVYTDFFSELLSAEQNQEAHRRIDAFKQKHWNSGNIFDAEGRRKRGG